MRVPENPPESPRTQQTAAPRPRWELRLAWRPHTAQLSSAGGVSSSSSPSASSPSGSSMRSSSAWRISSNDTLLRDRSGGGVGAGGGRRGGGASFEAWAGEPCSGRRSVLVLVEIVRGEELLDLVLLRDLLHGGDLIARDEAVVVRVDRLELLARLLDLQPECTMHRSSAAVESRLMASVIRPQALRGGACMPTASHAQGLCASRSVAG